MIMALPGLFSYRFFICGFFFFFFFFFVIPCAYSLFLLVPREDCLVIMAFPFFHLYNCIKSSVARH